MRREVKIILAAVVLVCLVVVGVKYFGKSNVQPSETKTQNQFPASNPAAENGFVSSDGLIVTNTTTTEKNTTGTASKTITAKPATLKYADALEIYRTSGYYFQFDNCRARPGTMIMKKGTKFMLDNRDPIAIKISFAGKNYYIAKYNFAIVTAEKVGTFNVTCNGGGSAEFTVVP